eukprot:CAMPEP_0172686924 /NCGR_PEP_ID=MMETSP1074-20121228/21291_1 /TAXON_ID=2916 /ORGANISM="Ceratium fusus, Strain PA161109" /LENGTH=57 /DNA_ID=CAMNT_0013506297 /DNA_START=890 /DNA_END=1063 /DNA_ORIENTATION=-
MSFNHVRTFAYLQAITSILATQVKDAACVTLIAFELKLLVQFIKFDKDQLFQNILDV